MENAVIVSACRTPIGKFGGGLASKKAVELGGICVAEAISRAGIASEDVDEVILGTVLAAGQGQAPARQAALLGGVPSSVSALTVNKVCGSALKAVMLAAQAIRAGDAQCVVAGGMESMSQAPYLLHDARWGQRLGHGQMTDSMIQDGLWCAVDDQHMGMTAELVAEEYEISREEQDAFAVESHRRAVESQETGRFKDEIVSVEIKGRKGAVTVVETDECPRPGSSVEKLAKLRPAFKRDGGTVTAANAPSTNDAASAVVVMAESLAKEKGLKPLARIVAYASASRDPKWTMMVPVDATRKVLEKAGWSVEDLDLVEANEAFSVQAVAVTRELGLDPEKVNVNGGAVALGHPIGAAGARILTTLLYAMKNREAKKGLATLCLGGGGAVSMLVEAME
jgi:acetyl-CoA C-acetyltransferase